MEANYLESVEIEVVFIENTNVEVPFKGTAYEIANEVMRRQLLFGEVAYYIPRKVGILLEVE